MTQQEAIESGKVKMKKIQDLAKELQVQIIAHQTILEGGIIRPVVYYDDMEAYTIDTPAETIVRKPLKINDKMPQDNPVGAQVMSLKQKDDKDTPTLE